MADLESAAKALQEMGGVLKEIENLSKAQPDVGGYREKLGELADEALDRRTSFDDFIRRVTIIIAAAYLLAFLLGSKMSQAEMALDDYMVLSGYTALAIASARKLAEEIYRGDYDDEGGRARLQGRLDLWGNALVAVYSFAHLLDKSNPWLKWIWSPEKDHCSDCIRLNGQVHKANEWRASGWFPQSHDLECHGFNCGCRWIQADGPSIGAF